MSEKRRDSKNRILRTGESQEADGRYKFRYIDANGKRKSVYSWRLVATDSVPAGKRDNAPLRDQEKMINRNIDDEIVPDGGGMTVLHLVKKYTATKTGVKHTTEAGYGTVINLLTRDPFGEKRIDKVRLSDAKAWLIRLQQEDVYEAFERILARRPKMKVEPMIDGHSGFLFFDKDGKPMVAMHWEKYFQHAVEKYNRIYRVQLPRITPHVCRHTYCSNMAKFGMNPKVLQYLMGHSDISVTLNTYTHLKLDDAKEEMQKLAQKSAEADEELQKMGKKDNELRPRRKRA